MMVGMMVASFSSIRKFQLRGGFKMSILNKFTDLKHLAGGCSARDPISMALWDFWSPKRENTVTKGVSTRQQLGS